ncbi:unnamed protein product [marine sediment metagenome]|uniref:Uncharacterized protein n=1 Tax=marine sediment metagenome TaxID=412755 RepID=X0SPX1_9ZZZZ
MNLGYALFVLKDGTKHQGIIALIRHFVKQELKVLVKIPKPESKYNALDVDPIVLADCSHCLDGIKKFYCKIPDCEIETRIPCPKCKLML